MSWKGILKAYKYGKVVHWFDIAPDLGEDEPYHKTSVSGIPTKQPFEDAKEYFQITGKEMGEILDRPQTDKNSNMHRTFYHFLNFGDTKAMYCLAHGYGPMDSWYDCPSCQKEEKENPYKDGRYVGLTPKQAFDQEVRGTTLGLRGDYQ